MFFQQNHVYIHMLNTILSAGSFVQNQKTAGQALVALLSNYGVKTVFGIPGVHTLELYRGLPGSGIRHILTRHEQGAAFMADGFARSTGQVGVCFLISGPGVSNACTAIGQAYSDSIPMLVISSVNSRETLGKGWGFLHECKNQTLLTEGITAFSAIAMSEQEIPELIAQAFDVFSSQRPRPVHISIPTDVLASWIENDWSTNTRPSAPAALVSNESLLAASRLIDQAKNVVLIAGGGAVLAGTAILELAEKTQANVLSTVAGKGIVNHDYPHYKGSILCLSAGWEIVAAADLVIAIGTELAETDFWRDRIDINGALIRIDLDAAHFKGRYDCTIGLEGDAKTTVQAINRLISSKPQKNSVNTINTQAQIHQELEPLQQQHLQIIQAIQKVLPSNAVVSSDMTQLAYSANYLMPMQQARRWLHPTGYGTLGFALPAGIGAQIACETDPVLVMVGDGGILYTLTELATAHEEVKGPLVILLWNNQALGQIRDDMVARNIEPIGVLPKAPRFDDLCKGFNCPYAKAQNLSDLQVLLTNGFNGKGPFLIELTPEAIKD